MSSKAEPSSSGAAPASSPPAAPAETASTPAHILPAAHWAEQALDDDDDADSALGDSDYQSTASLTSSILAYRTLHGRTYNSDRVSETQNWIPNDDSNMEASDIIHHALVLVNDGELFRSPLKTESLEHVLDVGTGTGRWAIEFADQYPNATVTATDISPNQPTWVPPNLHFELDDATLEWVYPENHFDFIHMRYLLGAIPDWCHLLRQAFRCCKPGGYVESFEASCLIKSDDGTVADGSPMDQWGKVFNEGGKKFGRPFDLVDRGLVKDAMEKAGFEDITEWKFKCPLGGWSKDRKLKEIGSYYLAGVMADLEGWILFMWTQVMGWTKEEVMVYVAHLRNQLRDRKVHGYFEMSVVYGRKPETSAA